MLHRKSVHAIGRMALAIVGNASDRRTGVGRAAIQSRPIRLLHGFAVGGAADAQSRIIADGLSKRLGRAG